MNKENKKKEIKPIIIKDYKEDIDKKLRKEFLRTSYLFGKVKAQMRVWLPEEQKKSEKKYHSIKDDFMTCMSSFNELVVAYGVFSNQEEDDLGNEAKGELSTREEKVLLLKEFKHFRDSLKLCYFVKNKQKENNKFEELNKIIDNFIEKDKK